MTVTIDELQVDVQKSAPAQGGGPPPAAHTEPVRLRAEQEKLLERERRLEAD